MTTTATDDVIDRIRKLLNLASSPNEHEAAAAATRAAALMAKHNLERAQVEVDTGEKAASPIVEEAVDALGSVIVHWKGELAASLGVTYGCRFFWEKKRQDGQVVVFAQLFGRQDDIRAVGYSYRYLVNEVERLADEAWAAKAPGADTARAWKHAFRIGCAFRIGKRLRETAAAATTTAPASTPNPQQAQVTEAALAVIQRDHREVEKAYDKMAKEKGLRLGKGTSCSNGGGLEAGRAAGDRVRLSGGAGLGAAQGRLAGSR